MTVMPRFVAAAPNLSRRYKARINCVAEFRDDGEVVQRHGLSFAIVRAQQCHLGGFLCLVDHLHLLQPLIALCSRPARRQHAHLVAAAHGALRQLHGFWSVPLEV